MGAKYHTIIVVPHSRAKYRKWRISTRQALISTAVAIVVTAAAITSTWLYFGTSVDLEELEALREQNVQLRVASNELEASFRTLQQRLAEFEDRTDQLAIVAGLEDAVDAQPVAGASGGGVGGEFTAPPAEPIDTAATNRRLNDLADRLASVDGRLEERQRWIAARPTIAPVRGVVTSYYGRRTDPMTGRPAFHSGIDISALAGRPVHASADGIVVSAGRLGNFGRAVKIAHGYGTTTLYGHLKELEVAAGQRVRRGDVIGTVGNTGRATGYHLHYEVRENNRSQNPIRFILDR